MKPSYLTTLKVTAGIGMFAMIIVLANAYTAPTTTAPGGNVPAPVNTGNKTQTKPGLLGLAAVIVGTSSGTSLSKGIEVKTSGDIYIMDGVTSQSNTNSFNWSPSFQTILSYTPDGKAYPIKLNVDNNNSSNKTLLPNGTADGQILVWKSGSSSIDPSYKGKWILQPAPVAAPTVSKSWNWVLDGQVGTVAGQSCVAWINSRLGTSLTANEIRRRSLLATPAVGQCIYRTGTSISSPVAGHVDAGTGKPLTYPSGGDPNIQGQSIDAYY